MEADSDPPPLGPPNACDGSVKPDCGWVPGLVEMTCVAKKWSARADGGEKTDAKTQAATAPLARRRRFSANGAAINARIAIALGSGIGVIPKIDASSLKIALT